jgi:Raf kinase inhibitor-like YbhB/YbcL family protein
MATFAALLAGGIMLASSGFALRSSEFQNGGTIPQADSYRGYGCSGQNTSPQLAWSAAPRGTKSFALTVFDPDARAGAGWWHWVIYDIPANVRTLAHDAGNAAGSGAPAGSAQGVTSFNATGYGGPCPPPGDAPHHYVFKIYALDVAHPARGAGPFSGPALLSALRGHVLGVAQLVGRFGR